MSTSKVAQLFRRGWIEIPDVMVGLGIGLVGLGLFGVAMYKLSNQEIQRPYKLHYIVKRDDDPDAAKYIRFHQNPKY